MSIIETKVNKNSSEIEKIWTVVRGNGIRGHEHRIADLEERTKDENCLGIKALEKYKKKLEDDVTNRRTWRIGDIANIIQVAMWGLVLWQIVTKL